METLWQMNASRRVDARDRAKRQSGYGARDPRVSGARADPGGKQRLANSGLDPVGCSPAEFAQRIRDESVRRARASKALGSRAGQACAGLA
jgi:hypothetical protein